MANAIPVHSASTTSQATSQATSGAARTVNVAPSQPSPTLDPVTSVVTPGNYAAIPRDGTYDAASAEAADPKSQPWTFPMPQAQVVNGTLVQNIYTHQATRTDH